MTEWRAIPGWPYSVSDCGDVRNDRTGRILRPEILKRGYHRVTFSLDGKTQRFSVHQLVCKIFNGEKPKGATLARHLDGMTDHNWPSNLAWGTHKDNEQDKRRHGTYQIGEGNPFSKLSEKEVLEIRRLHAENLKNRIDLGFTRVDNGTMPRLASMFGVSVVAIKMVVQRINWKHV